MDLAAILINKEVVRYRRNYRLYLLQNVNIVYINASVYMVQKYHIAYNWVNRIDL